MGTGFGATRPRAHPTPLPAEPRRSRSRPAWRYGSLRASAAAGFCRAGDGNGQKSAIAYGPVRFSRLPEGWVGVRGAGRAKLPVLGGPGGFLDVSELIWESLFGSAWQGGQD